MESLLITKGAVPYSAKGAAGTVNTLTLQSELNDLREGSLVLFGDTGERAAAAGTGITAASKFLQYIVGGPAGVDTKMGPRMPISVKSSYTKSLYVAPVAQVAVLGGDGVAVKTSGAFAAADIGTEFVCTSASSSGDFRAGTTALLQVVSTGVALAANTDLVLGAKYLVIAAGTPDAWGTGALTSSLSGSLVVGTKGLGKTYGVTVVDLGADEGERTRYDVTLTMTDAAMTDAAMLAAVVSAFNAHPKASLFATAAVAASNAGIVFTAVNAGIPFQILAKGLFYGSTVISDGSGLSIVNGIGVGTNAAMVALEKSTSAGYGYTATEMMTDRIYTYPSQVEAGKTYVVYVFTWKNDREVAYKAENANSQYQMLNLAVPSDDSTMIAAIDAYLTS